MGFLDVTFDDDLVGGLIAHMHRDVGRGSIGDLAMQTERGVALRAVGLLRLDLERSAVVRQPATGQKLIEAVKPAQAAVCRQVDKGRVHGSVGDGRAPAQPMTLERSGPDPHPPGGHHREREPAVVDLDQVDAVAPAAPEPALLDRALALGGK